MRSAVALAVLASLGLAASAVAATARLDDTQFIQANRCLGLMSSTALATPDATALKRLIQDQIAGRAAFIYDRADEARDNALRQADRSRADAQAKLVAERDGVCRSFLTRPATTAQTSRAHSS